MQAYFVRVSVLLGLYAQLCAAASSSARVSKAARAAVSSEGAVIPDWRLEAHSMVDADVAPPLLEHAPTQVPLGVPHQVAGEQQCHPLKLPAHVQVVAEELNWRSLTGAWYGHDEVRLATWQRNHFRTDFVTMFINSDVERALALEEVSSKTDAEMISEYNWRAAGEPEPAQNVPILDCHRRLLTVFRMRETEFHEVEIYAPDGTLLANTRIDLDRERLQFVDPSSGFLIATAEAPAINSSLTRAQLSAAADPARAFVLPYEIRFEAGGYTNASQLLSAEYRWAVATAVQSRAALFAPAPVSAHTGELLSTPRMPRWYIALQVLGVLLAVGLVFALGFAIYRLVYPAAPQFANPPHGYFRKPARIPAVKKAGSFVERHLSSVGRGPPPSPPTAYIIKD